MNKLSSTRYWSDSEGVIKSDRLKINPGVKSKSCYGHTLVADTQQLNAGVHF